MMKNVLSIILVSVLLLGLAGCGGSQEEAKEPETTGWKQTFSEAGFSEDEMAGYEEVLTTIGVTDFHDVQIIENGVMHIVTGKIYDSTNLQLNVTLEDRAVIYAEIAGIPAQKTEAYINWRGKLKTKTVDTKTSVEMFSDTEGGYLAVLDWDTKTISEIEG